MLTLKMNEYINEMKSEMEIKEKLIEERIKK